MPKTGGHIKDQTFVTPNFAGYVSGHSTFSRAAAEIVIKSYQQPLFSGRSTHFNAKQNEFLVFEDGPSQDIESGGCHIEMQQTIYQEFRGIHPYIDDIPGRIIGNIIGNDSYEFGIQYFENSLSSPEIKLPIPRLLANPIRTGEEIYVINAEEYYKFNLFTIEGKKIEISPIYQNNIFKISTLNLPKGSIF